MNNFQEIIKDLELEKCPFCDIPISLSIYYIADGNLINDNHEICSKIITYEHIASSCRKTIIVEKYNNEKKYIKICFLIEKYSIVFFPFTTVVLNTDNMRPIIQNKNIKFNLKDDKKIINKIRNFILIA